MQEMLRQAVKPPRNRAAAQPGRRATGRSKDQDTGSTGQSGDRYSQTRLNPNIYRVC